LKYFELQPLRSIQELHEDPAQTLLLVLGDTEIINGEDLLRFLEFRERGGAALIATDRRFPRFSRGRRYGQPSLGFQIDGAPVSIFPSSPSAYRRLPDCPLIKETKRGHPVFRGHRLGIATNRPSFLVVNPSPQSSNTRLSVIAELPPECRKTAGLGSSQSPLGPRETGVAAESEIVGDGRVPSRLLVLADHSVFIDEMMLQRDNDNFDFAFNCIEWLTGTDAGRRTRVLFMDQGQVHTDFDLPFPRLPLPDPPLPSEAEMVTAVNQWIAEMERKNLFNRLAYELLPEGLGRPLAYLLTVVLVAYAVYRLGKSRSAREPFTAAGGLAPALLATVMDPMRQRHRSMLRTGNLWEAARALARQSLETAGAGQIAPGPAGPLCPRITVYGPWWRRWRLRRHVDRLWAIGFGTAPQSVSPRHFARLAQQVKVVTQAAADGSLRLEPQQELRERPEETT
jgi:hypothetical protein